MKTFKNLMVLGLTLTSLSSWSQSASETSREINAQTTITRGHIDNVLERISRQRPNSAFRASDFWPQSKDYKVKVEAALVKFEDTLEKEILAKAAYWMDQYNSIYNSSDYSREQKAVLLKQREEFIKNQFATLSQDYQKALMEVYNLIPLLDLTLTYEYSPATLKLSTSEDANKKVAVKMKTNKSLASSSQFNIEVQEYQGLFFIPRNSTEGSAGKMRIDGDDGVSQSSRSGFTRRHSYYEINFSQMDFKFPELEQVLYQKLMYSEIKGTCKSSICLGLRAGEFSTLLGSVKTLIDRDMKLTLASGVEFQIKGLNKDISLISSLLNRVDYPEVLPFDI